MRYNDSDKQIYNFLLKNMAYKKQYDFANWIESQITINKWLTIKLLDIIDSFEVEEGKVASYNISFPMIKRFNLHNTLSNITLVEESNISFDNAMARILWDEYNKFDESIISFLPKYYVPVKRVISNRAE